MTARLGRILAIADSESYVKWAARLLDGLDSPSARLVIVDSPHPTHPESDPGGRRGDQLGGPPPPPPRSWRGTGSGRC